MMIWFKRHWLLLAILLLSLFLRLYRLESTMTFLEDEGRDLLIAKRMIDTGRPVLLGPQTSTGNMYLGPLYYYLITPALFLSNMDPIGPAIFIALTGVLTTYLLFVLGKAWFGTRAGFLASSLFAVLPFAVVVTRASWNPNLVPLITVLILLVFSRLILPHPKLYHWLLYGILVGTMVQLHYMTLILCGVLSLCIAWHLRQHLLKLFQGVAIAILGFVLILAPFLIFEIRNDAVNSRAIFRFVEAKEEHNLRYQMPLWLWWGKVSQTSYRLIGNTFVGSALGDQPSTPLIVQSFLGLALIGLLVGWRRQHFTSTRLSWLVLANLAVLGIYQEFIHLHYLEFFIPLLILLVVATLSQNSPRGLQLIGGIFILMVVILGGQRTWSYLNSGSNLQVERARIIANFISREAAGRPYNLVSSPHTSTSPYQYFAFTSAHPPSNTQTNLVFMICAERACTPEEIDSPLIFIHGPSHPSLSAYIGHPLAAYVVERRRIIRNDHVSHGVWVAELVLE